MSNKDLLKFLAVAILVFVLFFSGTVSVFKFLFSNEEVVIEEEEVEEEVVIEEEEVEEDLEVDLFKAMQNISSFFIEAEIEVLGKIGKDFNLSVFADISTDYKEKKIKSDISANIFIEEDYFETGLNLIFSEEVLYFKINSFPLEIIMDKEDLSIDFINNVWIAIEEDVQSEEDKWELFLGVIQKEDFYEKEKVGESSELVQYKVVFNEEAIVDLVLILDETYTREMALEDITKFRDELFFNIWINKESGYLERIFFENYLMADDEELYLSINLQFSQFNEDFVFIVPEEYKRLEEVMEELFSLIFVF